MAYRTLDLTLISAKDLNDVNIFSKMDVYAIATISGDLRTQQRTPIDRNCGKNPSWNSTLRFPIPSDPAASSHLFLDILIKSDRLLGDRDIGEVHIPIKELLEAPKEGSNFVTYQVRKPHSGKSKGVINLSYKFVDLPVIAGPPPPMGITGNEPVMAYPAGGASGSGYPPPQPAYPQAGGYQNYQYPPQGGYPAYPQPAGYGYGAPPPQGYGYGGAPPQGYGGYPQQNYPQQNKKSNMGMGLGAGLIGGAIGGMLIGDMISDGDFGDGF